MSFTWRIDRVPGDQLDRLEASVLWYTEGKGDEDLAVHAFWEVHSSELKESAVSASTGLPSPATRACCQTVTTTLPLTPVSYEGRLLRIRWCVRLRLFLTSGEEILMQQPFYLGALTKEV